MFAEFRKHARRWQHWNEAGREVAGELGNARMRRIRYEELVSDPSPVVAALCEFLGIAFAPAMLTSGTRAASLADNPWHGNLNNPIGPGSIGRHRQGYASAAAAVERHAPSMTLYGYEPARRGAATAVMTGTLRLLRQLLPDVLA